MKNIKRLGCLFVIVILILPLGALASEAEEDKKSGTKKILDTGIVDCKTTKYANDLVQNRVSLKDMSEKECFDTLVEYGLEIPEGFKDYEGKEAFVKRIVDSVLENPNCLSWYSYTESENLALMIRDIVLKYEGIEDPVDAEIKQLFYGESQQTIADIKDVEKDKITSVEEHVCLRDMTADECYDVLIANGLVIQDGWKGISDLKEVIKENAIYALEYPDCIGRYSFTESNIMAYYVREAAFKYEGIDDPLDEEFKELMLYMWENPGYMPEMEIKK
ncbi:MAG: hypothetical protein E7266_08060 [Lachnospiraceae bacterium]|nr:hypothetical protein [Lachnospiraceae bacterium]